MVLASNIYAMPFFYKYQDILQKYELKADLIYWNRDGITENEPKNIHFITYNRKSTYNDGNKRKIIDFLMFARFVKRIIRKNKYDRIVFLGNYGATHILLSSFLKKNYKKNYWLDYRDYNYEGIKLYLNIETQVIRNSYATAISSEGYMEFLPSHDYILVHNLDLKSIEECKKIPHVYDSKIRISFVGNVRYIDENIKLLNAFKNDDRFVLQYYGNGSDKIKRYCELNDIKNVDFYGRFAHEDTPIFYSKTDIINNIYGNSGVELRTALSNKLYFSAALDMPIIVCPNTYMEKISSEYEFGFTFEDTDTKVSDRLFLFYQNFISKGKDGCKQFIRRVLEEDHLFEKKFVEYVKG